MFVPSSVPKRRSGRLCTHATVRALTLVEVIISIGVLSMTSMGGVSAFLLLNKYAASTRDLSMARALCQERVEQALTLPFRPTNAVVPMAPSSDPSNPAACAILGASSSYNSSGAFTGGTNAQTSSETIPIYTQSTGSAASSSANVTFTRTTTVSVAPLTNTTSSTTSATSLNVVKFTVTVSYVFRGQTYTTSMNILRAPD